MSAVLSALCGARIFDGTRCHDGAALVLRGGTVEAITPLAELPTDIPRTEFDGGTLAPGFVDLQVNGGGGLMFNDDPNPETLARIAEAHARLGATTILPTLITDRPEVVRAAVDAAATAAASGIPGIAGLHLEGPHLSQVRKGAHDPALIRPMDEDDLAFLLAAAGRVPVLMVTVAPESVTPAQMRRMAKAGIVLSLGHSDCGIDAALTAAEAGARCVTHLFNAMSQLGNREPGLVGAALTSPLLSSGLIADLIHVHPASIVAALAAKRGPGRVFLVSDAMATAGSQISEFVLNGRVIRRRDGRLTLQDGTLAGADLDLATAVRNLAGLGIAREDALAMATSIPASLISSTTAGHIRGGDPATLVLLDRHGALAGVWRDGTPIADIAPPSPTLAP